MMSLVNRVQSLLPEIRERALSIEEARQIPKDIIDRLVEIGFMRAMVPAERGGAEEEWIDWVQSVRLLASADMATGWVAGLLSCHPHGVTFFDKRVQDEVWSTGPDTIVATSAAPVGRSIRVDGGVRLSGRYPFSSGCDHGNWTILGFILEQSDSREAGPYYCLVPRNEYRIEDDWFTSGLRGTGSKSVVVDDIFVPEYRWFGPGIERGPMHPGLYKNPMFTSAYFAVYNAPFAAIALGGAEGALAVATSDLQRRKGAFSGKRAAESASRQTNLGEVALELRGAAALIEKNWRYMSDYFHEGRCQTDEEIRWWRADDVYASNLARHAVDLLVNDAGGSVQYSHRALQRFWRDIHTACEHPWLDTLISTQNIGQLCLGEPLTPLLG